MRQFFKMTNYYVFDDLKFDLIFVIRVCCRFFLLIFHKWQYHENTENKHLTMLEKSQFFYWTDPHHFWRRHRNQFKNMRSHQFDRLAIRIESPELLAIKIKNEFPLINTWFSLFTSNSCSSKVIQIRWSLLLSINWTGKF